MSEKFTHTLTYHEACREARKWSWKDIRSGNTRTFAEMVAGKPPPGCENNPAVVQTNK